MNSEIDLWHFPLDGEVASALPFLDQAESAALSRFTAPRLASAFAIRRAARRIILARYLATAPMQVAYADGGKPAVDGGGPAFSASHTERLGILAVGAEPLGADVERHRHVSAPALASRLLSPAERLEHAALSADRAQGALFRLWCGKEALVKALGTGLDLRDLPLITLPVAPRTDWSKALVAGRMAQHGSWKVCWPDLGDEWSSAIAARKPLPIRLHDARDLLAAQGLLIRRSAP